MTARLASKFLGCVRALPWLAAVLLAACGGAKETDLFGAPSSDGGGASDAASSDGSQGADGAHPRDSGQPVGDLGVHCENAECPVPAQVCCRREVGPGYSFACTAAGQCNGGGNTLEIACDDAHDCTGGQVCCVSASQQNTATEVLCRTVADCQQQGRAVVCDPSAATPCPSGKSCQPSQQTLPGYNICR
jgi:hypothetical protein